MRVYLDIKMSFDFENDESIREEFRIYNETVEPKYRGLENFLMHKMTGDAKNLIRGIKFTMGPV